MLAVVHPDTDDLLRVVDGCEQLDGAQGDAPLAAGHARTREAQPRIAWGGMQGGSRVEGPLYSPWLPLLESSYVGITLL